MRRLLVTAALALVGEVYLAVRYAEFGALFHYWLHGLWGMAAGLAVVVLGRSARSPRTGPGAQLVAAAAVGRLLFAAPDVLFLALDTPHAGWMDVFGAHISLHFVPAPVAWAYAAFAVAVVAASLGALGRRRPTAGLGVAVVVLLVAGLAVRQPLPRTLDDVRGDPEIAWSCTLPREAW
ncbi:hypothetical protein BH20ACT7_BH20ACT7_19120 [soil metagenome]